MSDPGGPSLDWDGIFQRARHHIVRRVLLVGAIAALAAVFLFSGGTASWKLVQAPNPQPSRHVKQHNNKTHHHKQGEGGEDEGGRREHQDGHDQGHGTSQPDPKPRTHCRKTVSAEGEYCDQVPTATTAGG